MFVTDHGFAPRTPQNRGTGVLSMGAVCLAACAAYGQAPDPALLHEQTLAGEIDDVSVQPFVILAWDDQGDFGPSTPGTTTDGWQEALDFCAAGGRDLYVKGGVGTASVYNITETIIFPSFADFLLDGGVYTIDGAGLAPSEDAVVVNSCRNCTIELGSISYSGDGVALRIAPTVAAPGDVSPTFTENVMFAHVVTAPFGSPGARIGDGIVFDSTGGPVNHNRIWFMSVSNFDISVDLVGAGLGIYANELVFERLHTNAIGSTLLRANAGVVNNTIRARVEVNQGAANVTGVDFAGITNALELTSLGGFGAGDDLVLAATARGNRIHMRNDQPMSLITDNSSFADNRLTWTGRPAPFSSVGGTSGTWVYEQRLFPSVVHIATPSVTSAEITRSSGGSITYSNPSSRDVFLDVGDTLTLMSGTNPTIVVMPRRGR